MNPGMVNQNFKADAPPTYTELNISQMQNNSQNNQQSLQNIQKSN